jgi:hypothetical protein
MSRGVGCELGRRKLLGSGETWISDFCCDKGCYSAQCMQDHRLDHSRDTHTESKLKTTRHKLHTASSLDVTACNGCVRATRPAAV